MSHETSAPTVVSATFRGAGPRVVWTYDGDGLWTSGDWSARTVDLRDVEPLS